MQQMFLQLALKMAIPLLVKVVKDMLKSTDVTGMREKLTSLLLDLASKTSTSVDDDLVTSLVPLLFSDENIDEFAKKVIPVLQEFVKNTQTQWDDEIILPILDTINEILHNTPTVNPVQ